MDAIRPDLQMPTLLDVTQLNANSFKTDGQSNDFAATLRDTHQPSTRKNAAHKPADSSAGGDRLPDGGNSPPAVTTPLLTAPSRIEQRVSNQSSGTAGTTSTKVSDVAAAPNAQVQPSVATAAHGAASAASAASPVSLPTPVAIATTAEDPDAVASATAASTAAASPPVPGTPPPAAPPLADSALSAGTLPPVAEANDSVAMTTRDTSSAIVATATPTVTACAAAPAIPATSIHTVPSLSSVETLARAGVADVAKANISLAKSVSANAVPATAAVVSTAAANLTSDATSTQPADPNATAQGLLAAAPGAVAPVAAGAANFAGAANSLATPDTGVPVTGAVAMTSISGIAMAQPASAAAAAATSQVVLTSAEAAAGTRAHGASAQAPLAAAATDGTAAFASLLNSSQSTDGATASETFKVTAGVDTPEFAQGVGNQVQVMLDGNLNSAKLQVNPASLGPVEVRIAIENGHAQVWMSSHSAVTRDALQATTTQLREMLGSQGFSQVSVDISQRSFQDRTPQPHSYDRQPPVERESTSAIQTPPGSAARSGSSVLDAYA